MWVCVTEGEPVCACGPLCAQARGGVTLQDDASLLLRHWMPPPPQELESPRGPSPPAAPRLRELPVHRVPVFPEPTWCLAQRKCQHVEEGGAGRTSWGGRTGCREAWAESPRLTGAQEGGCQPGPQGCNALRPHQAEPHVRLQTHFSGFCFREPTSQSLVARPEGEVLASRLLGRLWTRG